MPGYKKFRIEIAVDYDSDEKLEILRETVRQCAKQILTAAVLISDKRKPQIAVESDDMFEGTETISLIDDNPDEAWGGTSEGNEDDGEVLDDENLGLWETS
jgi:hypothetical protein